MNNDLTMLADLLKQITSQEDSAEIAFSLNQKDEIPGVRVRVQIKREGSTFQKSIVFPGDDMVNEAMAYHLKEAVRECHKTANP